MRLLGCCAGWPTRDSRRRSARCTVSSHGRGRWPSSRGRLRCRARHSSNGSRSSAGRGREWDCAAHVHAAAPKIVTQCRARSTPVLSPHTRGSDLPSGAHGSRTQRSRAHASDDADTRFCTGWSGRTGRIDLPGVQALLERVGGAVDSFVCGPDGFVEAASALLMQAGPGHAIRTERFGPTGR
jgi:hypothetical protein